MNSFDFLMALNEFDAGYVSEAIELMYPERAGCHTGLRRKKLGRTLLIAAVIISIFTALCAGAYALNLFGIRELLLPGGFVERFQEGAVFVDTQALSVQGIESSREFMAYKEFKSFYDDYTAKDYYGDQVPQEQDEEMEKYGQAYFCYTRTLMDKLLEIADKYGLKLRESRYDNEGLDILIVDDGAGSAALFYYGPAAFVTLVLDYFDEPMTEDGLEQIAEGINFLGLGAETQVDEEARQPRPTAPPPTGEELQERRNNIATGTVDLGESFWGNPYSPVNSKLEISVEELSLSDNIYAAGWKPEQFLEYSVVSREENGTWESFSYPDYFDRNSGELIDGVRFLTVKIRVTNRHGGDADPGVGTNLFANCQLHLINAGKTIRGEDNSYTDNIAYSGPWGGGQYSLVEILPGETVSYSLGYAIDDAFPLEEAWLATVPQGIPGTYIPASLAEIK